MILTMFSEEAFHKHSINIFDIDKENSYITISDNVSSHYGFDIVEIFTCQDCKKKKIQVEEEDQGEEITGSGGALAPCTCVKIHSTENQAQGIGRGT